MTQRNALDLVFDLALKFKQIDEVLSSNLKATREKDVSFSIMQSTVIIKLKVQWIWPSQHLNTISIMSKIPVF